MAPHLKTIKAVSSKILFFNFIQTRDSLLKGFLYK